jgi:hypothetical protein
VLTQKFLKRCIEIKQNFTQQFSKNVKDTVLRVRRMGPNKGNRFAERIGLTKIK